MSIINSNNLLAVYTFSYKSYANSSHCYINYNINTGNRKLCIDTHNIFTISTCFSDQKYS